MENDLGFMAATDESYAKAKALHEGLKEQSKTVKAMVFMRSMEKSATAKEQSALSSMDFIRHQSKIDDAALELYTLHAKRLTTSLRIDCWRSLNAARNKGQIV
jgi:hypothetical protein